MLARDIQANQMSFACRTSSGSLPNGHYEQNPLPHFNSNFYVDYSTQAGHGVSAVPANGYADSVMRKPYDNKIPGFSRRKYHGSIYDSQVPVSYNPMRIPERVPNSSYLPGHASGPWSQQTSIYDNSFITPASLHTPLQPASVAERSSVNESFAPYGNYCYVDNIVTGHCLNTSLYNSGNLASHDISHPCSNKQYSITAASSCLEAPTCHGDVKEVTCPNSATQGRISHVKNEALRDNTLNPPCRSKGQVVDLENKIQRINDIIWNEMKDDALDGGIQENGTRKNTLKSGPLFTKRFSTFRRLVRQFSHDSRQRAKKDEACSDGWTALRNSSCVKEMFSGTTEGRWFTEQKSHPGESSAPSDCANTNDKTESSNREDGTVKNIILSLVCEDLKIKDPLVYLKFPFYSVEGEQLRPFLKRCVKLNNNQTTGSDQNVQNISLTTETSNLFDDEPLCDENTTEPMEYSDTTRIFNLHKDTAFTSEFSVDDLKQTISCIGQSYVEHLGKLSSRLRTEKKQWILDVYTDLCRLRERIFGPMSSVKAELQHEIFYATGINVDFTRNIVSQYSSRIYKRLPDVVKFFCSVPGFRELHFDDKRTLISECLLECWFLGWFNNADANKSILIDIDHQILLCVDNLKESFSSEHRFIKEEMEIAVGLSQLQLTPKEVIILKAVILLYPTRPGLKDPVLVESMSRKCRECLRFLLYQNHEEAEKILSEIDASFLQFRRVSSHYRSNSCKELILDITKNVDFLNQISA